MRALIAFLVLLPSAAVAQTAGPLVVEPIDHAFIVAPDFKLTDLDGETGQLAGAYAGRLLDNALFVGGGAYWLLNGARGEEMRYGGLLVGWSMPAGNRIRFGGRGLVGIGTATLGRDVQLQGGVTRNRRAARTFPSQTVRFLAEDDFVVFEPQVNAGVTVMPHVGVEVGAGYRLTGATDVLDEQLNGVTGSVAVQFSF
jgi:hypothetical protein